MKITLQQITEGEEEMILRYRNLSDEMQAILHVVQKRDMRLSGVSQEGDNQTVLLSPDEIFYFESVDGITYAYLRDGVYRIAESLNEVLARYVSTGFIRCARTMAVNIYKMEKLKSESCGRIQATLSNGECIMISRKYAGELRVRLRRGAE